MSRCSRSFIWYSFAASIFMHMSRFWNWLRSFWQLTTMPVGMWMRRTAEDVLLMCWPPAPDERNTSILMSSGRISTVILSSISGITSSEAKLVWRRPDASNGETRTSRCTPFSLFKKP